jgi:lipoyl(octanoyl) transferase
MQCRFIDTGINDAYTNMAIDEAILQNSLVPTLRVYSWKPRAVSIGYNQNIQDINVERCKELGIDVVRRISGGKAVFHDSETTYSFIVPEDTKLLSTSITQSYRTIANALVIALNQFGIESEVTRERVSIDTPICFNASNFYELSVYNRKISGSAQRRMQGKILQHGPILIDFYYETNAAIFNSSNPIDSLESLERRITSLKKELGREVDFEELAEAIKLGFEKNFDFEMVEGTLTDTEMELAERLRKEKYSTEEWNSKIVKVN